MNDMVSNDSNSERIHELMNESMSLLNTERVKKLIDKLMGLSK